MCPDQTPRPHAPVPGLALRRRLAIRLGPVAGDRAAWLGGGRSATAVRLGRGAAAVVIKITRAAPAPGGQRARTDASGWACAGPLSAVQDTALGTAKDAAQDTTDGTARGPGAGGSAGAARRRGPPVTGGPLFPVDPLLEIRVMAALARHGLAARPAMAIHHGPDICLAYPFQPGRAGQPPGPALARLLRRLHGLTCAGLPRLPGPPAGRAALLSRARDRLALEPDWPALVTRVDAAAAAAQAPPPRGARPLHGDPVPGNVVHGPRGVRLIDWHSAHRGDPGHDLALALSPAMQVIHRLPPCTAPQRSAFLGAYGCPATTDRFAATAAWHHALMIGHCLWRQDRGDRAYGPALDAEIAALRTLPAP